MTPWRLLTDETPRVDRDPKDVVPTGAHPAGVTVGSEVEPCSSSTGRASGSVRWRPSTGARSPHGPAGSPASSVRTVPGKTTAMRAVFGLVELDAGAVRWRGAPIGAASGCGSATCPRSGACTPACGCATSCVYLGELVRPHRDATSAAASTPGSSVSAWPTGPSDRVDALSHGNQQRVQLIAALVNEPELLVLDEPFSGLDPIAMAVMAELLAEVAAAGATVLFSSHQLDLVEDLCEDVVIIDHGRVVLAGELDELRAAVPQRFVDIRYRGAAPDWSALPGGRGRRGRATGEARLRVDRDADLAAVVAVAADAADVVSFAYQPPTLSELFRQAVAA